MKAGLGCCLLLLSCTLCATMQISPLHDTASQAIHQASQFGKKAFLTAAISASFVASTMTPIPALAVPTLNDAIVDVSESSYPIIKALRGDTFRPFSIKIADLLLTIQPDKLATSIGLGIDVLDSAPPEKLDEFNAVLKEAFSDLKTDSCTLVPLPPLSVVDRFKAIAVDKVPSTKLKTFEETWAPSLGALSKTDAAICLPSVAKLDKLSIAQADLARSFGKDEGKAFVSYTGPVLKSSITLSKVFPLLGDAKKLAPTATVAEKAAFQAAGKKIELASKQEVARNERALESARSAEKKKEAVEEENARKEAQARLSVEITAKKAAQEEKRAAANAELKASSDPAVIQAKKEAAKKAAEEDRIAKAEKLEATIAANKAAKAASNK